MFTQTQEGKKKAMQAVLKQTQEERKKAIQMAIMERPTDIRLWQELKAIIDATKAVWTTRYINDLPDEAFAIILSGGEKDETGKTVPRSLRKLPHHVASVRDADDDASVDWPHLLNALARVEQIEGATREEIDSAKKHLRAHFDRIKATEEVQE